MISNRALGTSSASALSKRTQPAQNDVGARSCSAARSMSPFVIARSAAVIGLSHQPATTRDNPITITVPAATLMARERGMSLTFTMIGCLDRTGQALEDLDTFSGVLRVRARNE